MYESLANFVISCPAETIPSLYLEDIALCAVWFESHEGDDEMAERYSPLRQIFDQWVREVVAPRADTEGFRQQPLIRELVGELTAGHATRLERDELDLLYFAVGFARRSGKLDIFRRVLSCTAPYMKSIEQIRAQKPLTPNCPNLGERLAVVTVEDIKSTKLRDVNTFGGINLPIRGPVYVRKGNLKILSGIPADCTVVVDQGSCCVRGNVEGNLATTDSCDILDNISGVVIARRGSVNAKEILNQSTVISKEDSVRAIAAESPKLVFAAREIHMKKDVLGGRFLARKAIFARDLCGGDVFTTEHAEARSFITTDKRSVRICLLRGLSCQDYGEVLSLESGTLLNSAMKLRQRLNQLEELSELAEREADDYAGTVLMYILGEGDMRERMHQIQKLRKRLSFLERLSVGTRALVMAAEDRINNCESHGESQASSSEDQAALDELRRELVALTNEGSIEPELHEEKEEVLYLGRKLQRRGMARQGLQQVLERLLIKDDAIEERLNTVSGKLRQEEVAIEEALGRKELLERARVECSRVEMFKQLSGAARKRPNSDIFKQRLNDRQVKILQRTMENRLSRMTGYQTTCLEIQDRIEGLRNRLWEEYMVSLPDHVLQGWAVGGARVEGSFSADVLVCAWRHLMDDQSGGGKGFSITTNAEDAPPVARVFLRTERNTIEEISPPEPDTPPDSLNV